MARSIIDELNQLDDLINATRIVAAQVRTSLTLESDLTRMLCVATVEEVESVTDLAIRAGILRRCECGWVGAQ